MEIEVFENEYNKMWLKDGILYGLYKKGAVIGLKQAKELVAHRKVLTKGKLVKGIIHISFINSISSEARKYFASDEATEGFEKMAFITTSMMMKVLGNTFLKYEKPKVPSKLFTNEDDARKWLLNN